jgi:hypothetical protein
VGGGNAAQFGGIIEEIDDGHFRIERTVLRQIADQRLGGAPVRLDIVPVDGDAARGRLQKAGQHLHDGGLARAVMAEETDDLAVWNLEADILDGGKASVFACQIFRENHRLLQPCADVSGVPVRKIAEISGSAKERIIAASLRKESGGVIWRRP